MIRAGQKSTPTTDPRGQWQNPQTGGTEYSEEDRVSDLLDEIQNTPTRAEYQARGDLQEEEDTGEALGNSPDSGLTGPNVVRLKDDDERSIQLETVPDIGTGQPPAKVSAVPGKSGSSEVFRTNVGIKYDPTQDDLADFQTVKCLSCGYLSKLFHIEKTGYRMDFSKGEGVVQPQGLAKCLRCDSTEMFSLGSATVE